MITLRGRGGTVGSGNSVPRIKRPHIAQWVRRLAVPIILGWLALTAYTNVAVPQIEVVGQEQSVPMAAADAPSTVAMYRIGKEIGRAHV